MFKIIKFWCHIVNTNKKEMFITFNNKIIQSRKYIIEHLINEITNLYMKKYIRMKSMIKFIEKSRLKILYYPFS